MEKQDKPFQFEISLSVLNHLGRNLYRNFITVLGEAISNSWDADAENVWIYIDKENNNFVIKDDGIGMDAGDFQNKFLRVGYSKRKSNGMKSQGGRPYIGAKGIGKLALLSCAEKISIVSKTPDTDYIGGVITNTGLDDAIEQEMTPDQYSLEEINSELFNLYTQKHEKGTIIHFEQTKENIRNTIPYLKKLIALYFRFSLIDKNFNIFVNEDCVTLDDLSDLSGATEFLWNINNLQDIYLDNYLTDLKENKTLIFPETSIKGFVASVNKPRFLKITGTEEKAGVDLFVNGRLRERNILKHLPDFSTRHVASYLYGQIHFDQLDNDILDKVFTSSREDVVADNSEFTKLLEVFKNKILEYISDEWDRWRLKHKEEGDIENKSMPKYQRRLKDSKDWRDKDFKEKIEEKIEDKKVANKLKEKLNELSEKNTAIYQDLFILENIFREYIKIKNINESDFDEEIDEEKDVLKTFHDLKKRRVDDEETHVLKGKIVNNEHYLNYLNLSELAVVIDYKIDEIHKKNIKKKNQKGRLLDAKEIEPVRNPVMHTTEITDDVLAWPKIKNVIDYIEKLNDNN